MLVILNMDVLLHLGSYNRIRQTEWLKQQKFIPRGSEVWEVYDQCASWFSPWWELSSWLVHGHLLCVFSSSPPVAFPQWVRMKREKEGERDVPNPKATNPIMRSPPLWPNLTLITSWMPHLQIASHWELGSQQYEFEGREILNIQSITGSDQV